MKKIIIITILLFSPLGVFAKEKWNLLESKNALSVEGDCASKEVKIELYELNKGEPAYNSSVLCINGKFVFKDNLLQWKSLKDGKYELLIDGDEQSIKTVEIQRPIIVPSVSNPPIANDSKKAEKPLSPELRFLGAFVSLQQSILDMRNWLSETKYPDLAKKMIGFTLDGVDSAVGKLSEMVSSSESIKDGVASDLPKEEIAPENSATEPATNSTEEAQGNEAKNADQISEIIPVTASDSASDVPLMN